MVLGCAGRGRSVYDRSGNPSCGDSGVQGSATLEAAPHQSFAVSPRNRASVAGELEICRIGKAGVRVVARSGIQQAADWVRQAPEVCFQIHEVNEWFATSLQYDDSPKD